MPKPKATPKKQAPDTHSKRAAIETRKSATLNKQQIVIGMLRRKRGVTIDDVTAKTGWQRHSVRGFFSGIVKKKLGLPLVSEVGKEGARRYRIMAGPVVV